MKRITKPLINVAAAVLIFPVYLVYLLGWAIGGRTRACESASQRASRWPGLTGQFLRRALWRRIIDRCGRDAVISFGTTVSKPTAILGDGVYLGAYCVLGDVHIGDNTLIADHVCIPSGSGQHGFDRLDTPIREQQGVFETIRIGADCWIGSSAVVLDDIGDHCVVAAGSVVTRPVPDYKIVAGNPARVIGDRCEKGIQREAVVA